MNRRSFIGSILALGLAPAIVRASSLMPVIARIPDSLILYGDGIHDDTKAMQAFMDGMKVIRPDGSAAMGGPITTGTFLISDTLIVGSRSLPWRVQNSVIRWIGPQDDHKPLVYVPYGAAYGPSGGQFTDVTFYTGPAR